MYNHEIHSLFKGRPDELVELLYELPEGRNYKRGYKLPTDIMSLTALSSLRQYWPRTKLIVGIRHPVKWFESYYNFRERKGSDLPPAEKMAGDGLPSRIYFHNHLSMLGKTDASDPKEQKLLSVLTGGKDKSDYGLEHYQSMPNEVFLYDVSQPFDKDEERNERFRRDVQSYLGLSQPLPPLEVRSTSRNFHYAIDICDPRFAMLRSDIMSVSRAASTWIRTYFLTLPDVHVSSPDYFDEILASWMKDPCDGVVNSNDQLSQQQQEKQQSTTEVDVRRPPLSELVDGYKVTSNVEFLLDFAIIGHAKCATTLLMHWIGHRDDVQMYSKEMHQLTFGKPAEFVKEMYKLPAGPQYRRGYKAPNDISHQTPRELLQKLFPHVPLVLGIRHPVKWFESWYNFKSRQGFELPPPETLRGRKLPFQVRFHTHLAMMGKTPLDEGEMKLVAPYMLDDDSADVVMKHPVFLYEVSQPFEKNETRNVMFREDLSNFLGLKSTLDKLVPRSTSRNFHYVLDICEVKYYDLRQELLQLGKDMSEWFTNYFLDLDDVTVSSPAHFKEMLATWGDDPCDKQERERNLLYK